MIYYKIKFNSFPKVTFAHIFTKTNYFSEFYGQNSIEIAYIEKGGVQYETEGEKFEIPENSLHVIFKKNHVKFTPYRDVIHTHYTVNLNASYTCERISNIESCENFLTLPQFITLDEKNIYFKDDLKNIIKEYNSHNIACEYKATAMAIDLLSEVSRYSFLNLKSDFLRFTQSDFLICSQIKKYVENNLNKDITLSDLAKLLNKTPNYINYVFKKVTGTTIKQYVNSEKINKVMQLMINYRITLKEAGEIVGIYDQNYLSRLFKKVTSMSAKSFIKNSFR